MLRNPKAAKTPTTLAIMKPTKTTKGKYTIAI
jgi:hypothetical protein